jgi:RNA polymerase sigma-70 factor (ECF subfamily)
MISKTAHLVPCSLAGNPIARLAVTKPPPDLSTSLDVSVAAATAGSEPLFDMGACLARVRQGDEDSARLLLEQLYPLVIKLVRSHLPRRTSEEDLAQIIFMKVFAKIEQFSGAVPFEHWVSRIAVNTCLNQIQAEKIRPEWRWADLSEDEQRVLESLASTAEEFEHPADHLASRELVEKLLGKLTPRDRLLITLIHLEGHSIEEVRKRTGWNASLIKVRAFRARHKLKKHLLTLMEAEKR